MSVRLLVWSINSADRLPTGRKGRLLLLSQFLPQSGSSDCVLEAVGPLAITIVMKAIEAPTLISGRVSQEILLRNEYLAAENEILRSRLGKRVALSRSERIRLAKLGKKLGGRSGTHQTSGAPAQLECVRRTLGAICEIRKLVATDPLRRE